MASELCSILGNKWLQQNKSYFSKEGLVSHFCHRCKQDNATWGALTNQESTSSTVVLCYSLTSDINGPFVLLKHLSSRSAVEESIH